MTVLRVGRRRVEITHPDKLLFPGDGITKRELAAYYQAVAPRMLPYLRHRPVNLERFPDGIGGTGFFQQVMPDYFPEWIEGVTLAKEGGTVRHAVLGNAAALVYAANQNVITPHAWLSRVDRPERPDMLIFDLDPPPAALDVVRVATLALRDVLDELGLMAFVKTTGSRGYHVTVALDRSLGFDAVRAFARGVGELLEQIRPDLVTTEVRKQARRGRIFLDTLRNAYAHTAVPPYAVRARAGAPVATPISWAELEEPDMTSARFTLRNLEQRLATVPDPWHGFRRSARPLAAAVRRLARLQGRALQGRG